jgi:AcrR family transcriptional regulator
MSLRLSAQDRRQQIMTIAVGLFARKGYQGTTTREIAEEAGVNEALLFRHFPSKENLYWTIIEEQCSARGRRRRINQILKSGGDDFQVFSAMAHEFLVRTPHDTKLTRLLWFTALENHTLSERFFRTYVADYYEALGSHIRERIRRGKFRKVDPLLAARGFFGMVVYHFLIQELFGGEKYQKFDPEHVSATLAGIWLAGMQSPGAALHANGSNGNHAQTSLPQVRRFSEKTSGKKMMLAKK